MPTLGDLLNYIISKKTSCIDYEECIELLGLNKLQYVFICDKETVKALLVWENMPNDSGHFIYFMGADNSNYRKQVILKGLKIGVWPKGARRNGNIVKYKYPEKLIRKLLTY